MDMTKQNTVLDFINFTGLLFCGIPMSQDYKLIDRSSEKNYQNILETKRIEVNGRTINLKEMILRPSLFVFDVSNNKKIILASFCNEHKDKIILINERRLSYADKLALIRNDVINLYFRNDVINEITKFV